MYKEYKGLNLPDIDKEILAYWDAHDIFHKSVQQRPEDNRFVFFEGPPSANGLPGIHHVMARTVKDLFCRFQSMQGKRVERKGGWDTHGLPIELNVEKELGITKEDIGTKITVDEYNQKCRETVMRFKDLWDDITRKMGYWVDLDDPYITFENNYIESVWWLLNELYHKGLLYKGYTIQPYSPAAGTGLSSHELNLPGCYKEVSDQSVVAQFKVKRNDHTAFLFDEVKEGEVYFLAWTTTPWTLPSNTALAVGAHIDYVRIFTYNPYTKLPVNLILAKDLLNAWFKPEAAEASFEEWTPEQKLIPYRITAEYKGATLEGVDYEQLMPYAQPDDGEAFKVLVGDFVSTEDGTGIVHIAPSFGADDMRVAKKYGIGALTLVDKQGKFVDEVTDFAGRYVKDYKDEGKSYESVDIDIVVMLKKENKAFATEKYVHNYPHCWRTDKPVLYYPLDSWFIRASAFKDRMFELNQTINWKPASTGEGRFGKWLENLQDWNLSRTRFWGIPLPIWRTKDGVYENCIDSVEELQKEIDKANKKLGMNQTVPADLHRPYIDEIVLVAENGEPMYREPDLIDVWFDSGAMPYAQWHYPFENKERFETGFPADFIAEGVDQTRGWFYTLHAIATMVFDSVAFKNVVSNGLVLDANGDKMSKSKGNVVDPFATITNYGADATRWYMISNAPPWDNLRFDPKGIEEVRRKFFGTLYNTYSFFALYANIDKFSYREADLPLEKRPESDRWIISELNSLVKNVAADFADYEPTSAVRRVENFVDEHLSNWYVRLNRRRFWKGDYSEDKIAAYQTLYTCLITVAKLMAPVAPFFADWLYRNLNEATGKESNESVHLSDFPKPDEQAIDKALEERMEYAQQISSLVLSLRKRENLRVRQPLQKILLPVLDPTFKKQIDAVKELILAEVNIKDIEYLEDTAGFLKKKIKPNFKTLGKRLGKDMKTAAGLIAQMDQDTINLIEKTGQYELHVDGTAYDLTAEDFEIVAEDIPGWLVATDGNLTVALDITLTESLLDEGLAREIVNRIQNTRKNQDFNVTDRIEVMLTPHPEVERAVAGFGDYIKNETLANSIAFADAMDGEETELREGVVVKIGVRKSKQEGKNQDHKIIKKGNKMNHLEVFKKQRPLISEFGENNAHLIWAMSIYLDYPDLISLGSESLTDGGDDKKIDFIKLDRDLRKIVFAQGYYSKKSVDSAPANKASDLNTACAWLLSGDLKNVPDNLKPIIEECRSAIKEGEIEQIDLLFVHNLPESVNVSKELITVANHLSKTLPPEYEITVISKELGLENLERLFLVQESSIVIKEQIECPGKIQFTEKGPKWTASILSVPGYWLRDLFLQHGDNLFSANYRGFLGISKRRKINSGIRNTAEKAPENFWVFNNGITILTTGVRTEKGNLFLDGISIINGAQTSGSIGSLDGDVDLKNVKVLTRMIECSDHATIDEIVKYNNTQNKITTWDKFSNDPQQIRIQDEFGKFGHSYTLKRGFDSASQLGIEVVAQPTIALEGQYQDANSGKNSVFESDKIYRLAFEDKKARHILLAYVLSRAIDERRNELKKKFSSGTIIELEKKQLNLLRNLRFKYFLISVFGRCLDVLLGKNVDLGQIGFTPEFSKQANKTLNDLIAEISPVVNMVLTYCSTFITQDFSDFIRQDNALVSLSDQVKSSIYASENANPSPVIQKLKEILCE